MNQVLKYPGSKLRISDWIIRKFPKHHSYLEPFFGSGAILFNKAPSEIETVNDLDDDVTNLFEVIRDTPEELQQAVFYTPYARSEYDKIFSRPNGSKIEKARKFLVRCWQGHGFRANAYKVGWKNDVQGRESAYAVRNWNRLPDALEVVVHRLKMVQIENLEARKLVQRFNYPNVFIYADPPYMAGTRNGKSYRYEMSDQDHQEFLEALIQHKGPAMISGYDNPMYNEILKDWHKDSVETNAEKGAKRIETIWMNYQEGPEQISIFERI